MHDFSYHRPESLKAAVELFESADEPNYLAGGHTLLPTMKSRLAAPSDLIDLGAVPQLTGISLMGDRLLVGAFETHFDVSRSPLVRNSIPALADLARSIGDVQVRYRGTIGGSLANNDPSADYPAAVLALGADIVTDRRVIGADDYFVGLFDTELEDGEIIVRVSFPVPASAGYVKFRNLASHYAIAGAFVACAPEGAVRVAITGAGNDGVFRWSAAEVALSEDFGPASLDNLEIGPDDMLGDLHGSGEYRAHLVAELSRRAIAAQGRADII